MIAIILQFARKRVIAELAERNRTSAAATS